MSYQAIVCKLTNVRKHPNADRLKIGTVQGYQVIIGLDQKEGNMGVFFACDGQLSDDHIKNNNLSQHSELNKDPESMGGFFGKNGRVKAQRFRGEKSEGFWQPLSAFFWTGVIGENIEGYQFDTLNGHRICKKYFTPATLKAMKQKNARKGKALGMKVDRSMLHEHYSTLQVRHHINLISEGSVLYITEKLHGSSGRTGYIKSKYPIYNKFKLGWNKLAVKIENSAIHISRKARILGFFKKLKLKSFDLNAKRYNSKWEYVSGTRRVILDQDVAIDNGYYSGTTFRQKIHNQIKTMGLKKGEVLYYEIVGFDDNGKSIMGAHSIEDKKMIKKYSNKMHYTYGCDSPECAIYIYRIVHMTNDGYEIDLSWPQVITRCKELGLNTVPLLKGPILHTTKEELLKELEILSNGPSTLDNCHIREGVVVRVEHENMFEVLKYKSYWFCEFENICKNSDNFIDPEEVA